MAYLTACVSCHIISGYSGSTGGGAGTDDPSSGSNSADANNPELYEPGAIQLNGTSYSQRLDRAMEHNI